MQFLFLSFVILFFTYSGLISDWRVYRFWCERATYLGSSYFEKGFDFLLYVSNMIGFFECIPITTMCSFFISFVLIYRYHLFDENRYFLVLTSCFIGFLPFYFGALRQAISSAFLIASLMFFFRGKKATGFLWGILAVLFHNSAIIIYVLISLFTFLNAYLRAIKFSNYCIILLLGLLIGYFLSYKYSESLLINYDMSYRIGNASVSENTLEIKDTLIFAERIVFIIFCLALIKRYKTLNYYPCEFYMAYISLAGNFFYIATYQFMRNVAGRTLGFFRYFDIIILYDAVCIILPYLLPQKQFAKNNSNYLINKGFNTTALFVCIIYSMVKYYFTIAIFF